MSEPKHSPAPFRIGFDDRGGVWIVNARDEGIALMWTVGDVDTPESRAEQQSNLDLFLAAPDLLAACTEGMAAIEGRERLHDVVLDAIVQKMRAAIEKAKGTTLAPLTREEEAAEALERR